MLPFALRQRLQWSGRLAPIAHGESFAPRTLREAELWARYELGAWPYSEKIAREALGTLDLLDRLGGALDGARVLDVGAKNWSYLPALLAWLGDRPQRLDGVEIDAYRLYLDFSTRFSHARAMIESARSASSAQIAYHALDVREFHDRVDGVTWLFPFLDLAPHRAWGLPRAVFGPRGALEHVLGLIEPGGWLVMANQGEWEWERARALFGEAKIRMRLERRLAVEGSLHASPYPIFLTLWIREE